MVFFFVYWMNVLIVKYGVDFVLLRKLNMLFVKMNLLVGDVLFEFVWIVVIVFGIFCV